MVLQMEIGDWIGVELGVGRSLGLVGRATSVVPGRACGKSYLFVLNDVKIKLPHWPTVETLNQPFPFRPAKNKKNNTGAYWELNPGPLAPKARIIPLDHTP